MSQVVHRGVLKEILLEMLLKLGGGNDGVGDDKTYTHMYILYSVYIYIYVCMQIGIEQIRIEIDKVLIYQGYIYIQRETYICVLYDFLKNLPLSGYYKARALISSAAARTPIYMTKHTTEFDCMYYIGKVRIIVKWKHYQVSETFL